MAKIKNIHKLFLILNQEKIIKIHSEYVEGRLDCTKCPTLKIHIPHTLLLCVQFSMKEIEKIMKTGEEK